MDARKRPRLSDDYTQEGEPVKHSPKRQTLRADALDPFRPSRTLEALREEARIRPRLAEKGRPLQEAAAGLGRLCSKIKTDLQKQEQLVERKYKALRDSQDAFDEQLAVNEAEFTRQRSFLDRVEAMLAKPRSPHAQVGASGEARQPERDELCVQRPREVRYHDGGNEAESTRRASLLDSDDNSMVSSRHQPEPER
ncbi:hypothetical protein N0V94_006703 [Neodidymelliopsis sp. IMI 364377]|nr:hypothetical protein N0V94_006703 [Neodidymelliopsis sp. IMI 364377]